MFLDFPSTETSWLRPQTLVLLMLTVTLTKVLDLEVPLPFLDSNAFICCRHSMSALLPRRRGEKIAVRFRQRQPL